jgi:hypothetical protein
MNPLLKKHIVLRVRNLLQTWRNDFEKNHFKYNTYTHTNTWGFHSIYVIVTVSCLDAIIYSFSIELNQLSDIVLLHIELRACLDSCAEHSMKCCNHTFPY